MRTGQIPSANHPLPTEVLSYHDGYEAQNGTVVQYQPEWTKQHQLEGDGLLPLLYDHLWKSDRTREHRLREALIPDTVVFEHNFPRAWYTYDTKTQELIKRAGKLLDSQSIYTYFCDEERGCDIVAQFYHRSVTTPIDGAHSGSRRSGRKGIENANGHHHRHGAAAAAEAEREELTTAVEFFTKETLFDFLHNRKTKPDGVLQKFLVPKGESSARHNFQLQAVWSPLVTLVYKRTNKFRLNDKTTPVYKRGATFDGLAHHSNESLVADATKARIDDLCKTIAQHFLLTEHKQITRLVMYFKIDEQERIWILWASSLRIGSDKLNPSYLRVPMQLAMRVENVNGGSSREEVQQARHKMHRALVDKDLDLYNLTGDWAFASQCAQKFDHDAFNDERRKQNRSPSPSSARGGGGRATAVAAAGGGHPGAKQPELLSLAAAPTGPRHIPQPPPQGVELMPASEFQGDAVTAISVPRYGRGPGSIANASVSTSHAARNQRMYISPRAPFLPTVDRQVASDVHSPRHPLHSAYALTHDEASPGGQRPAGTQPHSGSVRSKAVMSSSSVSGSASTPRLTHTVKLRKTEQERVQDELNAMAQDILYDAYSTAMEGRSQNVFQVRKVVLPRDIVKCLTVAEIEELVRLLHLEPDAEALAERRQSNNAQGEGVPRPAADDDEADGGVSEKVDAYIIPHGTLGRGRRLDRPVAQVSEDVSAFFRQLFADPDAMERIVATWRMLHL